MSRKLHFEGDNLVGTWRNIQHQVDILKELFKNGIKLGISSRVRVLKQLESLMRPFKSRDDFELMP